MTRTKVATLDELRDFARAFSDWFRDFEFELWKSPLSSRERDKIAAICEEIADKTEEIDAIVEHSQRWEPER